MRLRKCPECGAYSLRSNCRCGSQTSSPHPARFVQKYLKWRKARQP